ncbi:MAG TPA: FHA domain-containing protein [Pyrinomonadaceae bacterium]|jgi:ABC-type multidrug transport system ATPase subunit|nr:FHA domain-containing protein [Pyrinomonadaceae bacterium]
MKIFIAEERNGQLQSEHGIERAVIKVGRDKAECQIIFDHPAWSMVSRRHAELRLENGRCMLEDLGSSHGTYVEGRRITQPTEVRAGSRMQFGTSGPILLLVRIEQSSAPAVQPQPKPQPAPPQNVKPQPTPPPQTPPAQPKPAPPSMPQPKPAPTPAPTPVPSGPYIELVNSARGQLQTFNADRDLIRLGRGADVEVMVEADAAVVSRRHAEIRRANGQFVLFDLGSFNGTFYNKRRVRAPTQLFDGDFIQLGTGGPICIFHDPAHPPPPTTPPLPTIAVGAGSSAPQPQPGTGGVSLELVQTQAFDPKPVLNVGRGAANEIRLDGLQISDKHARLSREQGQVYVEDSGSTNGVYVNGTRIVAKTLLQTTDVVQIGPFLFETDPQRGVAVFDTRAKTRIDVVGVTKFVKNNTGAGTLKLLDNVDLVIQPNEFVGMLGPSGAGKSTLMDALNGMRPATSGNVLVNRLDLYKHLDSLKQSIGYVPQDDIIHRELTVYRTLYYVARLRLSSDVTEQDIEQIVSEVLDVTGLSERRDVPVGQLSGGQRKRVSIAVELITKPSVIFLDEPTSGLDPATEEKIMKLFRQIAESGRTVILTTHAMENVKLFDKIVVLMRGKLVFYGTPHEALAHVKAQSFKDLYDKLEEPISVRIKKLPPLRSDATLAQQKARKAEKEQIAEDVAEDWKRRFQQTEQYRKNIQQQLAGLRNQVKPAAPAKLTRGVSGSLRQWKTLARRYLEIFSRDKMNLLILLGQAPLIALLTWLVVGEKIPRDFPYFMIALVAVWFGASIAAREIIRERAVYNRERMVNLGLFPYVGSKLAVLSLVVGLQCLLLVGSLKLLSAAGLLKLPGEYYGLSHLLVMILTAVVGIALGLFVSAIVKTSEMATSLVPLILIPQILFSGLVDVPKGVSKVVGVAMPATWSFDEMKRLSALDVLRGKDEGAQPSGSDDGRGLYKRIQHENDENIGDAQAKIAKYKKDSEKSIDDFKERMDKYQTDLGKYQMRQVSDEPEKPPPPALEEPPKVAKAVPIPDNLSEYVDHLHSWGGKWRDIGALALIFFLLVGATVIALKSQDIG